MDQLRREFEEYTRFLRQALQLDERAPEGRRARRGRRFQAALGLARPAARAQRAFAPYLEDLGQEPDDLLAQRERVVLLMRMYRHLAQLTHVVHDTLLRERADLLDMGLGVVEALALLLEHAELPPPLRRRMGTTLSALRRRAAPPPRAEPLRELGPAPPRLPAPRRAERSPATQLRLPAPRRAESPPTAAPPMPGRTGKRRS